MRLRETVIASLLLLTSIGDMAAQTGNPPEENLLGILLAAGDIAECDTQAKRANSMATATRLLEQLKDAQTNKTPVHVLALGDLAYESGSPQEFHDCFDKSWGQLFDPNNKIDKGVMLPVPGNHEYTVSNSAKPFFDYFVEKQNPWIFQQDPQHKRLGYFALDFPDATKGPWRLIGLNSERDKQARDAQNTWLRQDLENSKASCVLAFWHRPVFSSNDHGHGDCDKEKKVIDEKTKQKKRPCRLTDAPKCRPDEEAKYCDAMRRMKDAYGTLYDQGATVILAGHDHGYEQFKRLDSNAKGSDKGVRSFIVGTGGANLYQSNYTFTWKEEHEVYHTGSFGILRIELYPSHYRWKFVPIEGNAEIPLPVNWDKCNTRP